MKAWSIAERAGKSDDDRIWELVARCYGDRWISSERFRHCYLGPRADTTRIVMAEAEGRVVGMQPVQWVPHRFRGTSIEAGILTGAMVDPEWRNRGVFSDLVSACERISFERGADLVWTMPNEKSSPGFRGAGYQFPGERRLFVWSPEPRKLMGGGGGGLGSAALGILSKPLLSRRPSRAKGLKTCEVERLNADAEELSLCFCREWDGILQDRDASWLGWRFGDGMGVPYRFLASCDDEGKTLAWAVVTKELRESREVGYILDLVARDPRAGKAVVAEALGVLAGWGVDLVMSAVCGRGLGALMVRAGMVPVPKALAPKRFFLAYRTAPGAGAEFVRTLRSPQSWYITLADWDAL